MRGILKLALVAVSLLTTSACGDLLGSEDESSTAREPSSSGGSNNGPNGTQVSACASGLATSQTASVSPWRALPAPFNGLDFKIYFSNTFQVYEIVFRNRFFQKIHFNYSPTGGSASTGNEFRTSLATDAFGSPPGVTVRGAVTGGSGCVVVHRVRFGANDSGAFF